MEKKTFRVCMAFMNFIAFFFISLTLGFFLSRLMPGSPFLGEIGSKVNWEEIGIKESEIGLDKPIIIQFLIYLKNLFTLNWGNSINLFPGTPVGKVIWPRLAVSLEIIFLACLVSVPLGWLMGRSIGEESKKSKRESRIAVIAIIGVIGLIMAFSLTLKLLFSFTIPIFPAQGYANIPNIAFLENHQITGFGLLDSILSLKFNIFFDILYHLFLPVLNLSFVLFAIFTGIFAQKYDIYQEERIPILAHPYALSGGIYSIIFFILKDIDVNFNINGIMRLSLNAVMNRDYFLILGLYLTFLLLILGTGLLIALATLKNPIMTTYNEISLDEMDKSLTSSTYENNSRLKYLKNGWFLTGASILMFMLIIAMLGSLFFSRQELTGIDMISEDYAPPSSDHWLGTMVYGQDVLGRILFGIQTSFISYLLLSITIFLGYLIGFYICPKSLKGQEVMKTFVSFIFVLPMPIILFMLSIPHISIILFIWPLFYSIWSGVYVYTKFGNYDNNKMSRKAIFRNNLYYHIAVVLALSLLGILFNYSLGYVSAFISFDSDYFLDIISLSGDIMLNRNKMFNAPWSVIYHYLAILLFILGFTLLIIGIWRVHNRE